MKRWLKSFQETWEAMEKVVEKMHEMGRLTSTRVIINSPTGQDLIRELGFYYVTELAECYESLQSQDPFGQSRWNALTKEEAIDAIHSLFEMGVIIIGPWENVLTIMQKSPLEHLEVSHYSKDPKYVDKLSEEDLWGLTYSILRLLNHLKKKPWRINAPDTDETPFMLALLQELIKALHKIAIYGFVDWDEFDWHFKAKNQKVINRINENY